MTELLSLDISLCHAITMKGLKYLANLTQLLALSIKGIRNTEDSFLKLVSINMKRLETLGISNSKLTDNGSKYLTRLSQLRDLAYVYSDIGKETIKNIAKIPRLQCLYIRGSIKLKAGNLSPLRKAKNLEILDITFCPNLEDEDLKSISKITSLISLTAKSCQSISMNAITKLMEKLPHLLLTYSNTSEESYNE